MPAYSLSESSPAARITTNMSAAWEIVARSLSIIPIDAQPPGTKGFGRAAGWYDREDFRPSSIRRTCSGLREPPRPETSHKPRNKESQTRTVSDRASQFDRCRARATVSQGHVLRDALTGPTLKCI
jgi:hypothetical protein